MVGDLGAAAERQAPPLTSPGRCWGCSPYCGEKPQIDLQIEDHQPEQGAIAVDPVGGWLYQALRAGEFGSSAIFSYLFVVVGVPIARVECRDRQVDLGAIYLCYFGGLDLGQLLLQHLNVEVEAYGFHLVPKSSHPVAVAITSTNRAASNAGRRS